MGGVPPETVTITVGVAGVGGGSGRTEIPPATTATTIVIAIASANLRVNGAAISQADVDRYRSIAPRRLAITHNDEAERERFRGVLEFRRRPPYNGLALMIREILGKLAEKQDLARDEAKGALVEILRGEATPAQIAAFATGLRVKGETVEEIVGCVQAMREAMVRVKIERPVVLDVVGTGGDGRGTYNISTLTALVAAAGGATVAKHGNRAASSKCGSADLFEALGVKLDAPPAVVERCLNEIGIAFLFAPLYHPALKHAGPVRKELGFRTVFNLLGPLCNPAGANTYALGVARPELVDKIGRVLQGLGIREAYVFHSDDGMDELSPYAPNRVCHVKGPAVKSFVIASDGLKDDGALQGGGVEKNRDAALSLLKRELGGALRVAVCMNAALALQAAGVAKSYPDGLQAAGRALDSGLAYSKLEQLRRMSHEN